MPLHARGGEAAEACYNLDNVFDSAWSTERVYRHTTGDIVGKVVGGFNGARRSPPQHQPRCAWLRLRARTGSCGSALTSGRQPAAAQPCPALARLSWHQACASPPCESLVQAPCLRTGRRAAARRTRCAGRPRSRASRCWPCATCSATSRARRSVSSCCAFHIWRRARPSRLLGAINLITTIHPAAGAPCSWRRGAACRTGRGPRKLALRACPTPCS